MFTDEQIKHMVNRFLGWKLPDDFSPDCGISFAREHSHQGPFGPQKYEPIGTNLLTAEQAEKMVRFMLDGMPLVPGGWAKVKDSSAPVAFKHLVEKP